MSDNFDVMFKWLNQRKVAYTLHYSLFNTILTNCLSCYSRNPTANWIMIHRLNFKHNMQKYCIYAQRLLQYLCTEV